MSGAESKPEAERRRRSAGLLALLAVQVLFGLFPVFGKWAFDGFAPRAVAAWRLFGGALALGAWAAVAHGRAAIPPRRRIGRIALCGGLGVAANQFLFVEGLARSTAMNATLLMLLIPVATYAIAVLLRHERWSGRRGAGLLLALGGAIRLVLADDMSAGPEHLLGNLLLCANALAYSLFLVLSRDLTREHPPLAVIAWMYILSAAAIPVLAWSVPVVPEAAPARAWLSLAFILVGPTVLAYFLNLFALARVPASTTAAWIALQPLITGAASAAAFGERPSSGTLVAAALILAGLWLVSRPGTTMNVAKQPRG